MAGLLEKVRIGFLAQAHNVLDKFVDLNSPQAVKEYIRELEGSIQGIENDAAEAAGHVTTTDREVHRLAGQIESYDHAIDVIVVSNDPSANDKARELQVKLNGFKQQLEAKQTELATAKETADAIGHSLSALRSKHQSMVQQLSTLETMDRAAKDKERAAKALQQAAKISSLGSDISVDDLASRIQARHDVADEKLKRALASVDDTLEKDVVLTQADADLAARRARLLGEKPALQLPKSTS
jgi:phage shock protein A